MCQLQSAYVLWKSNDDSTARIFSLLKKCATGFVRVHFAIGVGTKFRAGKVTGAPSNRESGVFQQAVVAERVSWNLRENSISQIAEQIEFIAIRWNPAGRICWLARDCYYRISTAGMP